MMDRNGLNLWERVMNTCRYMLFRLDGRVTKCFDVVESVTHLFVNMCQYDRRRNSKLIILFMLAAMYSANYRALIIIKICLDLVPEILPHECQKEKTLYSKLYLCATAVKTVTFAITYLPLFFSGMNPLFQIFIFLLHFYNCKDEHNKVQQLRFTLKRRYGYDPTQENVHTILFKVKQTVLEINGKIQLKFLR